MVIVYGQNERVPERWSARSGYGFYSDIFGVFRKVGAQPGSEPGQPGSMLWFEYRFHLNEKSSIVAFVGSGHSQFTRYFDEPFTSSRVSVSYWQFNINFYRSFQVKKITFDFGVGPSFFATEMPGFIYKIGRINDEGIVYTYYYDYAIEREKDAVLGLNVDLDFEYRLNTNLGMGLKCNGLVTMFYGPEAILVSPYLIFRF